MNVRTVVRSWGMMAMFALAVAAPARASLGGPTLVEVLGYDAKTATVYVRMEPHDEAASPEVYGCFALNDTARGGVRFKKLAGRAAVPAGLRPLRQRAATSRAQTTLVLTDAVHACGVSTPRHRLRFEGSRGMPRLAPLDVHTLREPRMLVLSAWAIPGRGETLAILSVDGDPCEAGWECQLPVVLRPHRDSGPIVNAEDYR